MSKVQIDGALQILNNSVIYSVTNSGGNSGDIQITANELTIDGYGIAAGILSQTKDAGDSANIAIHTTGDVRVMNAGSIQALSTDEGNAGDITITAENLHIDGETAVGAYIVSSAGDPWGRGIWTRWQSAN